MPAAPSKALPAARNGRLLDVFTLYHPAKSILSRVSLHMIDDKHIEGSFRFLQPEPKLPFQGCREIRNRIRIDGVPWLSWRRTDHCKRINHPHRRIVQLEVVPSHQSCLVHHMLRTQSHRDGTHQSTPGGPPARYTYMPVRCDGHDIGTAGRKLREAVLVLGEPARRRPCIGSRRKGAVR